ncbi:MAG: tRNA (adenosine(37)-N6)-dimethylallyltransferase MiaA [Candidatus Shapirobacteria bacterium]|jgi:tRNA dimethylallyltransferase
MFNKLLIISGPTATGKTDLASKLAKKYNGELVSTDSCQIYTGLNIGTGKDQPDETPIHLVDIINPDQKFSVSQFQKAGLEVINQLHSQNKLPVLVGCSGFYLDSLINPNYNTFSIPPSKFWRFISTKLSVKTLQKIYNFLDKDGFSKLNHSDINNHYRLTRKIEIKLSPNKIRNLKLEIRNYDILHISLTAPLDFLYKRIDARVDKRMEIGFLDEIKILLKKYKWSDPGLQIAAYQCLRPYFENKKKAPLHQGELPEGLRGLIQHWRYAEHSDARRQSTYFKSRYSTKALFFDITDKSFQKTVFNHVAKWYTKL